MKAVILAAGYATRLYPLTLDKPKALLDLNGRAILDYIVDEIETLDEVNEIILVSNHKFYGQFLKWADSRNFSKPVKVIDDGTNDDAEKLGAIGDLKLAIDQQKINEDILVLAGDNFFTFKLKAFYDFYLDKTSDCILAHELVKPEDLRRMGVILTDPDGMVLDFEEKPEKPKSNLAVFAAYIYKKETLPMFESYLQEGNRPDAPGYFPAWLHKKKNIFAYLFDGQCYDIGTHESLNEVREMLKTKAR